MQVLRNFFGVILELYWSSRIIKYHLIFNCETQFCNLILRLSLKGVGFGFAGEKAEGRAPTERAKRERRASEARESETKRREQRTESQPKARRQRTKSQQ